MLRHTLIVGLLLFVLMPLALAVPHTRWNDQLDVCVYYYDQGGLSKHCFVEEKHCIVEPYKPNWFQEIGLEHCRPYTSVARGYISFEIKKPNLAPLLSVANVDVKANEKVTLKPVCTDPENETVKLTYAGKMTSATWQTSYKDAGEYEVDVTCTDGQGATTNATANVIVHRVNRAPLFQKPA